jgi:hypothetical protein
MFLNSRTSKCHFLAAAKGLVGQALPDLSDKMLPRVQTDLKTNSLQESIFMPRASRDGSIPVAIFMTQLHAPEEFLSLSL